MTQTHQESRSVRFSFETNVPVSGVSVIGDFNHWDSMANPMKKSGSGVWTTEIDMPVGAHLFKYRLSDGHTVLAPDCPSKRDLGGNTNSVLLVTPSSFDELPGIKGDGKITESAIRHRPDVEDTGRIDARRFWLRLRTRANDVEAVTIHVGASKSSMSVVASNGIYDTWQGEFLPNTKAGEYSFEVRDGSTKLTVGPYRQNFAAWPMPEIPEWANGAVYYQIFPDRFENGDRSNDGPDVVPWGSTPTFRNRMGGDLRGVINRLDHLQELGVEVIYLNPIFKSGTNHGYDTYDYMLIDPRFGTNEELKELVAKAHSKGIKVILDAVFNHSGTRFFAFENLRFHGMESDYKDWYFPLKYPIEVERGQKTYRTFATSFTMPKLNTDNPATKKYLLNVTKYWMTFANIDGWRLDVADEVSPDFWRAFRKEVKGINRDAIIIGEIWPDAHKWLQGDQHDSVMNYRWKDAVLRYFSDATETASEFESSLAQVRNDYPAATLNTLYLLLDSHDTKRLKNEFHGNRSLAELAVGFQFAYPGSPAIYYGDEIGMEGEGDPDCRRCMIWDESKWDQDLLGLYKKLIAARKALPELRHGSYKWMENLPVGCFGFIRQSGTRTVRAYFNKGDKDVAINEKGHLTIGNGAVVAEGSLHLKPYGFAYLQ